jgi:hypothetical protein
MGLVSCSNANSSKLSLISLLLLKISLHIDRNNMLSNLFVILSSRRPATVMRKMASGRTIRAKTHHDRHVSYLSITDRDVSDLSITDTASYRTNSFSDIDISQQLIHNTGYCWRSLIQTWTLTKNPCFHSRRAQAKYIPSFGETFMFCACFSSDNLYWKSIIN